MVAISSDYAAARVTDAVMVPIPLVGVICCRADVAEVAHAVGIGVGLVRAVQERAVVDIRAQAIAVDVIERIKRTWIDIGAETVAVNVI